MAFLVTLLPVVLATLPPFVGSEGRTLLMQAFAPVCHQMPSRSPYLMGVQLAVGHRVYGILIGLALGSISYLPLRRWDRIFSRHPRWVLAGGVLPMAVDWVVGVVGLWANTPVSRMVTGGLFGVVASLFLTRAIVQAALSAPRQRDASPDSTH